MYQLRLNAVVSVVELVSHLTYIFIVTIVNGRNTDLLTMVSRWIQTYRLTPMREHL